MTRATGVRDEERLDRDEATFVGDRDHDVVLGAAVAEPCRPGRAVAGARRHRRPPARAAGAVAQRRMTASTVRRAAVVPAPTLVAVQPITGVVQHYAWGDRRLHPPSPRRRTRRPTVGRAVARHPRQRPGDARRRPPARRRHRRAAVPAEGARRRRTALAADAPEPQPGRGRVRRWPLPRPGAEARAAVRADPVHGVLRRAAGRRDARPARRARRRRAGRGVRRHGPGGALDALYRGRLPSSRSSGRGHERPPRGVVGAPAGGALPRRPERRRHAAAQPRRAAHPARRSSSGRATSTPTSAAPASS